MPSTALYRKSSSEVVKISTTGQDFSDRDPNYWGVLTNPSTPDGTEAREMLPDGTLGPLRELGFAKFAVVASNIARNATEAEIATYLPAEEEDTKQQDAAQAGVMTDTHPMWRKVLKAMTKLIVNELNILRALVSTQLISSAALVWDAASIANAAGLTSPNIMASGANFGDYVLVTASGSLQNLTCTAFVSAANTVVIRLQNSTGSAVNLPSMTFNVIVVRSHSLPLRTHQQGYSALSSQIHKDD